MDQPSWLSRRSRRVASAGALVVVGAVLAGTLVASAAPPALPKRTPAQLLVDMRHATLPPAMTAVITQTANLGFPALPDIPGLSSSTLSAASLITGTHTVDIWYAGPEHVRIALPVSFGETDLRVNGHQIWLWDSKSQTATRYILPAMVRPQFVPPVRQPVVFCGRPRGVSLRKLKQQARATGVPLSLLLFCGHRYVIAKPVTGAKPKSTSSAPPVAVPSPAELTPLQAADRLLALVGPTTKVTVQGTTTVAGRPAYQLAIAPRSASSLIGEILIAVDAKLYLPLQVQVYARGSSSPAFQVGFTSLTLGQPAMSNFTFTPPPGAKVKTERLPSTLHGAFPAFGHMGWVGVPGQVGVPGWASGPAGMPGQAPAWTQVVLPRQAVHGHISYRKLRRLLREFRASGGLVATREVIKEVGHKQVIIMGSSGFVNAGPGPFTSGAGPFTSGAGPRVLGSGWLSVLVLPAAPVLSAVTSGGPRGLAESAVYQSAVSSTMVARSGPPGQFAALLHTLLNAAVKVHGSWGTGRLLRTTLFSVLITSKGDVLIGAVTPAVLYADAAKVK